MVDRVSLMRAVLGLLLAGVLGLPAPAVAGPETVATVAPVHALVARVMQGAGAPHLLIPPGTSPHNYAMRPSDAAALERAEVVFWVGPRVEGWLERPLATLAADARTVRLDSVSGLTLLPLREGTRFAEHRDEGGQTHGNEIDPHLWLDPDNAKVWLNAIAEVLAVADPAGRETYAANAEAARAELDALAAELAERLAPLRGRPFVVFHDAFHYFERRFGVEAAGAVTLSDARAPGPARVAEIRELIRETGAKCVFREPQFRPALAETVAEGTGAEVGVLDPIGANLEPGPGLYAALLRGLARAMAACLG